MRTDGRPDGAVDEGFVLPASSAQQRIWLLHQLDPLGLAYSAPSVAVLRGVELPYELLCRELEMGGAPPSPAAFEAMPLCHDTPVPLPELGDVGATRFPGVDARLPSSSAVSSCDIVVEAVEEAGSIMISVTYRSGRLDDATARGLLQELEHVLVGMTGAPDRSVARL